jgi:hypothetical protein
MARKKYIALLTQSSTQDPSANVLANSIGTLTAARTGTGVYTLTSADAVFTENQTTIKIASTESCVVSAVRTSDTVVTIKTELIDGSGVAVADAKLNDNVIEIEVFD